MGTVSGPTWGSVSKCFPVLLLFTCCGFSLAVYKLIAVVVSPAGGALLLILVIALAVTCRR